MTGGHNAGILFGDIVDSMQLYETFGDRAALDAIDGCLGAIGEVVRRFDGTVVKTIGDELMAAFPDALGGSLAARAVQERVEGLPPLRAPDSTAKLRLRIGFVFGPVIEDRGDYFGDTVNVASRLVRIARPGQIMTTLDTVALLPPPHRAATRQLADQFVKGRSEELSVVEMLWQKERDLTHVVRMAGERSIGPGSNRKLVLTIGDRRWVFDDNHGRIELGRDRACEVPLADANASRRHATLERRRGQWVLTDHSTNGTYVTLADADEIELCREDLILIGSGRISFGHPAADADPAELLSFQLA
ncbi:adenylate/guanylate cyclase domain-containing protein [Prosthecomicrobium sp. N25]|uniref:adenylate/guanylate cyclase domain-containing protein n=1 Tax=Prosthecomicrobium sp. N25 TaxID=3129254 RepID=UPI0030775C1A